MTLAALAPPRAGEPRPRAGGGQGRKPTCAGQGQACAATKAARRRPQAVPQAASRNPMRRMPMRSAWRSRTIWSGPATSTAWQRRVRRARGRGGEGVPETAGRQGNRRAQPAGARALAGAAKPKQDAVGWRMLVDRRERRAHRHSGQAHAADSADHRRHALDIGARRSAGRDASASRAGHDACSGVRAHEEGAGRPQGSTTM